MISAGLLLRSKGIDLFVVLCELDVLCSPCGKLLVKLGNLVESGLNLVLLTLAGSDDGAEVVCISIVAGDGGRSLVELVVEDVCDNGVAAAARSIFKILGSGLVVTAEDVKETTVGLCYSGTGLLEVSGSGVVVTIAESENTKSILVVAVPVCRA